MVGRSGGKVRRNQARKNGPKKKTTTHAPPRSWEADFLAKWLTPMEGSTSKSRMETIGEKVSS